MTFVRIFIVKFALGVLCSSAPVQASGTNDHPIAAHAWEGEWSNPRGFVYWARMELVVADDGAASGSILWTLRTSPRPWERDKLGLTGVEHIHGTWSEADASLVFDGVSKDDPHGILGLDSYRLTLTDSGRLVGVTRSYDPEWGGIFVLAAVLPSLPEPVPLSVRRTADPTAAALALPTAEPNSGNDRPR